MDKLIILPPTTWPGLPGGGPTTGTTPGDPQRSQLTVAGKDAVVPILYGGPERIGGMVYSVGVGAASHPYQEWRGALSVVFLFCEGPVDTINALDVEVNDKPYYHADYRNGIAVAVFDGSQVAVPGWLAQFDPTWTETLNGYCGLHMRVMPGFLEGFPRVTALVKGKKIFDPRTSTTVWSDNPALIVRDIVATYEGRSVDESAAADAADACDTLVGTPPSEKRSRLTLLINEKRLTAEWRKIAAEYMPGWVQDHGAFMRIVVDAPGGSVVHTFDHSNIAQDPPPRLTKLAGFDVPDVVEVGYTDTSDVPWTMRWAVAGTGNAKTRIERPGIRSYAQALRVAYTTLNHLTLENVEGEIAVFDYGLKVMPGDLAQITLSMFGWTNKQVRVVRASDRGNGWWTVAFRIYDPAAYNDDVVATPTWPGTDLPTATLPPTVANLTLNFGNGDTGRPYIVAHWDGVVWPFFESYYVQVWDSTETDLLQAATVYAPRFVSGPLNGGQYVVKVFVRSTQATIGVAAEDTILILEWQAYGTGHVRYDKIIIDDDDHWIDMVDPGSGDQPTWNVDENGARLFYRRPFKDWVLRVANTPTNGLATSVLFISDSEMSFMGTLWAGLDVIATQSLISTVVTGTAPVVVTSTTLCGNLNADLLDGQHGAYYTDSANHTGTVAPARLGSGTPSSATFLRGDGTWSAALVGALTVSALISGTVALNAGANVALANGQVVQTGLSTAVIYTANTLLCTNLNADLVDGYHATTAATASTVAVRDASGILYAANINFGTGNPSLKIRHIDGHDGGGVNYGSLYLNYYASNSNVYIGSGSGTAALFVNTIYSYTSAGLTVGLDASNPRLTVSATAPELVLYSTSGTANQRKGRIIMGDGFLYIDIVNDAISSRWTTWSLIIGYNVMYANTDNACALGSVSYRWTAVYAVNGTIQTSDAAKKRDVHETPLGLDFVMRTHPVAYRWKDDPARLHHGFIGQELLALSEELGVDLGAVLPDGTGVNYAGLIAPLYQAVRQQQAMIDQLRRGQAAH